MYTDVHDAGCVIAPEDDDLNERMTSLNTRICPEGEGLHEACGLACPSLSRRWTACEGRDILAWGGVDGATEMCRCEHDRLNLPYRWVLSDDGRCRNVHCVNYEP